jgi:fluoride exporter
VVVRSGGGRQPFATGHVVAIACGGALGTLARYGADESIGGGTSGFPWSTLVVNVVGSFLLGVILTLVVERWPPTRFARPFAAIGFCGGFTTFSTFAVEILQLGQHDRNGLAAVYLLLSLVLGLAAAATGIAVVRGRPPIAAGAGGAMGVPRSIPDPDDLGALIDSDDDADEDPVRA